MMRVFLILIILLCWLSCFATTYYVSNAGSDGANGISDITPWQTIGKVNGFTFTSGDTVKFKCGDTWIERLLPQSNVYYTNYSSGIKPLITGFQTASLGAPSANVYTATTTDAISRLNTVLINDKISIKARYPNSGYLTYTSGTTTSLTTSLTGTPSYTGKEIVVRTAHWVIDISKVTGQVAGALTLSPAITYTPNLGCNGYFFQNDETFLDSANEWSYDSTATTLKVYATVTPAVKYSTIDTLVWIRNKTNVTFDGISFTGANYKCFQIDTCSYITIKNSTINNCGAFGIAAEKSHHTTITSDSIMNCLSNGIYPRSIVPTTPMADTCNNTTISYCYIKNMGIHAGMGGGGNERYNGIEVCGDSSVITNNRIDSCGYIGIRFNGRASLIKNNYITNTGNPKDDGAGIYTVIGAYVQANYNDSSIIRGNIIGNSIPALSGTDTTSIYANAPSAGIYLDDDCKAIIVDSNTVFNCWKKTLNLRTVTYINVKDNVFVDSLSNIVNATGGNTVNHHNSYLRNIFYQKNRLMYVFYTEAKQGITSADSDYYARPTDTTNIIRWENRNLTLKAYQDSTGLETHGGRAPQLITTNPGVISVLHYNPTLSDSTITLDDNSYIDVYGTTYINRQSFTLRPFTSKLLFRHLYTYTKSDYFFTGNP